MLYNTYVFTFSSYKNEVARMTDQHYRRTDTSSGTLGHEATPLRVKGDIEDVSSELDDGGKGCTSWMRSPEFYCSQRELDS
ncbi:hypothetical protein TNCV_5083101 [Trichonephila clavipes]|nr:hypothetical protein TNCV_5083101 [Trichonephila clavipes]